MFARASRVQTAFEDWAKVCEEAIDREGVSLPRRQMGAADCHALMCCDGERATLCDPIVGEKPKGDPGARRWKGEKVGMRDQVRDGEGRGRFWSRCHASRVRARRRACKGARRRGVLPR